jgi:hypothetical protein
MNIVETLSSVIAEQAKKIAELEAFIASKMVMTIAVTKPTAGLGSIAEAQPDLPVRENGRQHAQAQGTARCIAPMDVDAARARARAAARKAADEDSDATYHFFDKMVSSSGEITLVWNVANSK